LSGYPWPHGYLKESERCSYPFSAGGESNLLKLFCRGNVFELVAKVGGDSAGHSAGGESNLLKLFCRGNVFETMTLRDAVMSITMKDFANEVCC